MSKSYKVYLLSDSEHDGCFHLILHANSALEALIQFSLNRSHGYLSESTMTFIDPFGTWSVKEFNYKTVA